MSRRLMLRDESGSTPILPSEYQQVEWIGKYTDPYFLLENIKPDGIDITLYKSTAQNGSGAGFFGYYQADDMFEMQIYEGNVNLYYGRNPPLVHNFGRVINTPTNIKIENQSLFIDGTFVKKAQNVPINPNNKSFGVFCLINSAGGINPGFNMRIYKLDLSQNGEVIVKLVPCYRKSDGVIGMYDTVSSVFHINRGGGSFLKGADV